MFHCEGSSSIRSDQRTRSIDEAARHFADRWGRSMFGRGGHCMALQRLYPKRRPTKAGWYRARIGTKQGIKTTTEFWVTMEEK